eukprot:TRINITY_DN11499_c0_g1_i1.p1 TRINITY_DN11499_c0_g1~~TRINITY_DN11499_c0_g1_i1.p1  ORF type:complete len:333 (-),score=70.33 TRINITY_DN11499_c0_g1_i1:55-906(-)
MHVQTQSSTRVQTSTQTDTKIRNASIQTEHVDSRPMYVNEHLKVYKEHQRHQQDMFEMHAPEPIHVRRKANRQNLSVSVHPNLRESVDSDIFSQLSDISQNVYVPQQTRQPKRYDPRIASMIGDVVGSTLFGEGDPSKQQGKADKGLLGPSLQNTIPTQNHDTIHGIDVARKKQAPNYKVTAAPKKDQFTQAVSTKKATQEMEMDSESRDSESGIHEVTVKMRIPRREKSIRPNEKLPKTPAQELLDSAPPLLDEEDDLVMMLEDHIKNLEENIRRLQVSKRL